MSEPVEDRALPPTQDDPPLHGPPPTAENPLPNRHHLSGEYPSGGEQPPTDENPGSGDDPRGTSENAQRRFEWPDEEDLPPELSGYRYGRDLTRGGQAVGMRVCRTPEGRDVVVKVLANPRLTIDRIWDRWRSLAEQENAVKLEKSFVHGGFAYEVTPYCQYGSLADRRDAFDTDELVQMTAQVARALHQAHTGFGPGNLLVHRDLKPANILVVSTEPLRVLLTDFGIASAQHIDDVQLNRAGTLYYTAPEALDGSSNPSADWWALGMTVAELAMGDHPFSNPTGRLSDETIRIRIRRADIPFAGLDGRIDKLCRGLTEFDWREGRRWRYREVKEWLDGGSPRTPGADRARDQWRDAAPRPSDADERPMRRDRRLAFSFAGTRYEDPVALALAICGNRQSWQEACGIVIGSRYGELESWANRHDNRLGQTMAQLRQEFINTDPPQHTDRCVTELVARLNQSILPVFRGRVLAEDGLLALITSAQDGKTALGFQAETSVSGRDTARPGAAEAARLRAEDDVNALFESGSLITLGGLDGQEHLYEIAERWAEQCDLAEGAIRSRLPESAQDLPRPELRARILGAILSEDLASELERQAEAAATRPAIRIAWFRGLSDEANRSGAPGIQAVVCASQPIAATGERNVDPHVQEAVRPYLEDVADRWRASGGMAAQPPAPPLLLAIRRPLHLRERVRPSAGILVRLAPAWAIFAADVGLGASLAMPVPAALAATALILVAGVGLAVGAEPWARPARQGLVGACLGVLVGVIPAALVGWAVGATAGPATGTPTFWTTWVLAATVGALGGMHE